MLTVSHQPGTSLYQCTLTVPKDDDGAFPAPERVIPTLDLESVIPIATVTDYPTIRPYSSIKAMGVMGDTEIPVQIDITETHYIYTFVTDTTDTETVNQALKRDFMAVHTTLLQRLYENSRMFFGSMYPSYMLTSVGIGHDMIEDVD